MAENGHGIEERVELSILYDFYGALLKDNQRRMFEASILDESMAVIANATVRCMTIGNDNMEKTDPDNPLKNLINYLNKKATPEDFGMPITFSAAYLKDNSVFVNKFTK